MITVRLLAIALQRKTLVANSVLPNLIQGYNFGVPYEDRMHYRRNDLQDCLNRFLLDKNTMDIARKQRSL